MKNVIFEISLIPQRVEYSNEQIKKIIKQLF